MASLLVQRGSAIVLIAPRHSRQTLISGARDASFSPDGTLVAFVRSGDLWTANADGSGQRRLAATPRAVESSPAWLPNGQGIIYQATVGGRRQIRVFQLPAGPSRRIAHSGGSGQEWSPAVSHSGRLAFVSDRSGSPRVYVARADGVGARVFDPASQPALPTDLRDLAWSPNGKRLAYTLVTPAGVTVVEIDNGKTTAVLPGAAAHPVWSPGGTRIAFDDSKGVLLTANTSGKDRRGLGVAQPLDWRDLPTAHILYPNLVQRPPSGLLIMSSGGRWLLGFTSLVDNRGPGVFWMRGRRPAHSKAMQAEQLLEQAGGGTLAVDNAGKFLFVDAWPHFHWHYLGYDRYELRSVSNFKLVARDHKEGFCLSDDYGAALGVAHGPPRFLAHCERFNPGASYVEEGTSVGYTDRYPGFYEGQDLNLTGLPAGTYWLVHQVNSDFHLRELRYDDDTASLLIRLSWPGGHGAAPRVTPLRSCLKARCE
jgi:hypothetical protein